ncbi:MAG: hypothetical protein ACR2JH_05310 [Solirubrobacteraceae bacterium]
MAGAEQQFDPRAILAALERNHANYVLIGGFARVIRGADEITHGVDITPSFAPDNLARLAAALTELDSRRHDGQPLAISDDGLAESITGLSTSAGVLNIVSSPAGAPAGFADLRRAATKEHLGHGVQPLVASVGDLARLAAALHREQDVARLPQLRRIIELEADRQVTITPPRRTTAIDRLRELDRERLKRGPQLER